MLNFKKNNKKNQNFFFTIYILMRMYNFNYLKYYHAFTTQ